MIIAFQNLFGMQYEGGANWLEVTLYGLGQVSPAPRCLLLGATRELLPASLRDANHVEAVPLKQPGSSRFGRIGAALTRRLLRRPWEDAGIADVAARYNINLWVGFSGFEGLAPHRPLLVWFPDFQCRYLPELFTPEEVRDRERQWDYVATRANGILAISDAVANDALHTHPQISEKLHVCAFPPLLPESMLRLPPDEVRRTYSLPEQFFLVCNQFWSHKNHQLVLEALKEMIAAGATPPIVAFTGRPHDYRNPDYFGELLRFVNSHGLHQYCRFLGVLPRAEQIALIRAATAVIQPSLFEGRGAIVEEAHLLGTQVLCSDLPVHRELRAPGALFFSPNKVSELVFLLRHDYPRSTRTTEDIVADSKDLAASYGEHFLKICAAIIHPGTVQPASSENYALRINEG